MPVSLPHALSPADLMAVPESSARRPSVIDRITGWLKTAEQRRAERLIAQYICASGIQDFGDSLERDIAVRHARLH
jgi:hypothetical protein